MTIWRWIASFLAPALRALGLEQINAMMRKWGAPEEPKIVLTTSRWTTLMRSIVHVLPITAMTGMIWVNYSRIFIGPTFSTNAKWDTFILASIQFAAKIVELLCVASLTTIVLHALRHELVGEGIPLGLLGSGVWFSSISAFWSPSFLGSISWKFRLPSWSRCRFYIILVICGFIAVFIGPASAIMLMPRVQNYPAGGASFYMLDRMNDLNPTNLTAALEHDICRSPNSTQYAVCPGSGYPSLLSSFALFNYTTFCWPHAWTYEPQCQAKGVEGNRQWNNFVVQSPSNLFPSVLNSVRRVDWESAVMQAHAVTALMMQSLVNSWQDITYLATEGNTGKFQRSYELRARGSATNPVVRVRCTKAQNLTTTTQHVAFPWLWTDSDNITTWSEYYSPPRNQSIAGLDLTPTEFLRARWLPLPIETFGDVSNGQHTAGLVVEMPWKNESCVAFGCAVVARWHDNDLQSQRSSAYGAWNVALSGEDYHGTKDSPNANAYSIPINLDISWLHLLSAPSSTANTSARIPSTVEGLLEAIGLHRRSNDLRTRPQPRVVDGVCKPSIMPQNWTDTELWLEATCDKGDWRTIIETILASLIADGIARSGSHNAFNVQNDMRDWSIKPMTVFNVSGVLSTVFNGTDVPSSNRTSRWMEIYPVGYAWNPTSPSDYAALAVVCLYMAVTVSFMLYTICLPSAPTSDAWDSITELLVLCLNSPPDDGEVSNGQLRNASVGIRHFGTYGTRVRVRAFAPSDGEGQHKVHLVVSENVAEPDAHKSLSSEHVEKASNSQKNTNIETVELPCGSSSGIHLHKATSRQSQPERVEKNRYYS